MGTFTSYVWIDSVLLDGMDYFAGVFFYFHKVAHALGWIIALIGILIGCIKLMYGGTTTQKFALSSMANFMIFIAAMSLYNLAVGTIAKTATVWGTEAGGGKRIVENNLVSLMKQCEHDLKVAKQMENLPPEQQKALVEQMKKHNITQQSLASGRTSKETSIFTKGVTNQKGASEYMNQVNLYRSAEKNVEAAQKNILALQSVLKPTQYKDKNGDLIDTYFLDIMIRDEKGNSSNFISPSAFLKTAILTAGLLWSREMDYLTVKMEKAKDDNKDSWVIPNWVAAIGAITINDIGNIILTGICVICIIFAAIFILIQYCAAMFEYAIVTSILIAFVPFVLAGETKNIAKKILPAFWGFAIKILILTICMWFAMYQYIYMAAGQMGEDSAVTLSVFAYIMFTILISFVVTQNAPQIAMTILTGSPQLSMGEFMQAAGTIAAGAMIVKRTATTTGKLASAAFGKGINTGATGLGITKESVAAFKSASQGVKKAGGTNTQAIIAGTEAVGNNVGSHVKNAAKNKIHSMSHSSLNKNGNGMQNGSKNGSSWGGNRFSAKDGSSFNRPDANHSSFVHAKNEDGSSKTFREYSDSMIKQGAERGNSVAEKWAAKHNKKQDNSSSGGAYEYSEGLSTLPPPVSQNKIAPTNRPPLPPPASRS